METSGSSMKIDETWSVVVLRVEAFSEAVISFLSCVVLLGYIQDGRREPSCSVGRGNFVSVITYKMR